MIYGNHTYKRAIPLLDELDLKFRISRVACRKNLTEEEKRELGIVSGRGSMIPLRPPKDEKWE